LSPPPIDYTNNLNQCSFDAEKQKVVSMIGTGELILILVIILILFGPKKLPELARAVGQSVKEYKEGLSEKPKKSKKIAG
jgi:sec-independent protein translocase protein TatA